MLIYVLIFIIAALVLIKSSAILIQALLNIARFMHWSEFVVSFVLMALATDMPDLFIGISSGFQGLSSLSLGNVIGANILKLSLVAGLLILFARGTKIENKTVLKRDIWIITGLAILPLIFLLNKTLSRLEGIILIGLFFSYLIYLTKTKKQFPKLINNQSEISTFFKSIMIFVIGISLLLASSWLVVYSVSKIAQGLNASLVLIGIFLIALATTLPEFIFGVRATMMKHEEMYVGNLLGAVVVDSALILGITALINPIQVQDFSSFAIGAVFMVLALLIFNLFIRTRSKLCWWEGALLALFYVIFIIIQII